MNTAQKCDRGRVELNSEECKGCGLCVAACKPQGLYLSDRLNHYGYRPVAYRGSGCNACGICFLVCPEPGAITVLRAV
jgi:NAD-dependent dihydropyrimidine dehydrogenase PreA subunit